MLLSIFYYGLTDEDSPDQDGNTNDAYDDDIGRDKEYDENAEPSSPAKKRKGNKQMIKFALQSPIHSFMLDLSDKITRQLFSKEDWIEICSNLPDGSPYSKEASDYLDEFECVETLKNLQDLLDKRPRHIESQLKERWSGDNVRERKEKNGVRADLVWRTVTSPETDWAIAEAAKVWCPQGNKYITESKFKLPRQLHDVLVGRTMEVGGANELRDAMVSGLIIGGPCLQRIGLCWGAAGDNVARIVKMEATRMDASVSYLSTSLLAIHDLLCFRSPESQGQAFFKLHRSTTTVISQSQDQTNKARTRELEPKLSPNMSIYRPENEQEEASQEQQQHTGEMTEKAPTLVFPPLTHQRLENCAFSSWYPKFRSVSIKSKIIPLPEEFVSYLNADGVFIPGQSGLTLALSDSENDSEDEDISDADRFKALQEATFRQRAEAGDEDSSDDEDEDDESEQGEVPLPHFPGLEREIEQTIDEFEGAVFPKLNWSSPRDASWIAATNTLKCQNVADIFLLLKSSDFIAHDLAHAYEDCSDAPAEGVNRVRPRPETVELVLRKWFDLAPSMEFRCFVRDNKLVAISQRDMTYYDFLRGIQEDLEDTIVDFFEDKINGHFPDSD
ncbi:hypothetical protein BGZ95_005647, partial [Linnemannia exigua]